MAYFEGQLKRTDTEPGEEHTGYVLETEIDMSAIQDVDELLGDQIAVTGDVEIVDFPERGKILVFRATSVAVLEEEEEEDQEDEELSPT
jgi:hypothetical protein